MLKLRLFFVFVLLSLVATMTMAAQPCATIKDGTILDGSGAVIQTGKDAWGYNYQAMMFNGTYCDAYRNAGWCQAYAEDTLIMKWNAAWLSNQDCDFDGKLDRHYGLPNYIGSGAWLTNHQRGEYADDNGEIQKWNYFVKIVAAPAGAKKVGGNWVSSDGVVIGPVIWGEFAVLLEIYNDSGTGEHGVLYKSPLAPGFGLY